MTQQVTTKGPGLGALLGEQVTFFCLNYIYHGKLIIVDEAHVVLNDVYIVYETGAFNEKGFKDAQYVAAEFRLRTAAIESYGVLTNKQF